MDIGAFLKLKRQEKDLTQKDVADAVGVSEGTVSRWESGKIGNMRRDKIEALAKVLSVDPLTITKYKYTYALGKDEVQKIMREYCSTAYSLDANKSSIAADAAIGTGAISTAGASAAAASAAAFNAATAGAVAVSAGAAGPIAAALAGLASAAKALSTLVTTSSDTDALSSPTEFTEEERQMIEDYRTLSDSDKQTIQLMIRSLKEKHTATSLDGNSEEG